jgi:hypothetical protein
MRFYICFFLLIAFTNGLYSQAPPAPVALRPVEQKQWDKAADGLDYSRDVPRPPKPRPQISLDPGGLDWTAGTANWGAFLQGLAIVLAVLAIGYGVYRMLQAPVNRSLARDGVEITLDNLDDYIHETDLDRFLREALAAGNFALAIRVYYLQTIKTLSEKKAIRWSREKTNRDYLTEMKAHPAQPLFRQITRRYERVWYGNQDLSASEFAQIEPDFKLFLGRI